MLLLGISEGSHMPIQVGSRDENTGTERALEEVLLNLAGFLNSLILRFTSTRKMY
jgi:hypothetical protein